MNGAGWRIDRDTEQVQEFGETNPFWWKRSADVDEVGLCFVALGRRAGLICECAKRSHFGHATEVAAIGSRMAIKAEYSIAPG